MTRAKRGLKVRMFLGTGLGLLAAFTADAAAQTDPTESEELVVTATRREEALTDIPLAVNAYSGTELQDQGIVAVSERFAKPYVEQGKLVRILPDWTLPEQIVWCVMPGRRLLPQRTRVFMELLAQVMQES